MYFLQLCVCLVLDYRVGLVSKNCQEVSGFIYTRTLVVSYKKTKKKKISHRRGGFKTRAHTPYESYSANRQKKSEFSLIELKAHKKKRI